MTLTRMTAAMFRMMEFPLLATAAFMDAILESYAKAAEEVERTRKFELSHRRQRPADTVVIRNAA